MNKPLNNNALIEVLRDDDNVSRVEDNESLKYGKLIDFSTNRFHLTASSAIRFTDEDIKEQTEILNGLMGEIVRWEEFAEGGQTFKEGGKTYASIPWWRLILTTTVKETK